jgi:hypothetical protein
MRPEGALRHRLTKGHWPEWVELGGLAYACKPCVFKSGRPRRRMPVLTFAPAPARL